MDPPPPEPPSPDSSAQPPIVCPTDCDICREPDDCVDCLICLYWPEVPEPLVRGPARGHALPAKSAEMAAARRGLVLSRRVGLVSRRFRRLRRLTQRQLAAELGWSRAALGRAESDASALALAKADTLLQHVGYRLAIVPDTGPAAVGEPDDLSWPAADLLARDGARRRPPPSSEVTWHPEGELRQDVDLRGREWTWRRLRS